jgi:hypothetical protein
MLQLRLAVFANSCGFIRFVITTCLSAQVWGELKQDHQKEGSIWTLSGSCHTNPQRRVLEKPPVDQLLKNSPTSWGSRRFITMLTRARHWSLSYAILIQPILPHHSICLRLISSSQLCLALHVNLFPSGVPTNILFALLFYFMRATCPAQITLLDFIILIIFKEKYKLWRCQERSRYSDWLRAGRPNGRSSSPGRGENFHFSTSSRSALGPTQPPIQ